MAVLDVRFYIFLVRFDIYRPIRHLVLPKFSMQLKQRKSLKGILFFTVSLK